VISGVLCRYDAWEKRERDLKMVAVISVIIDMGLLPCLSIPHVLQKIAQGLRIALYHRKSQPYACSQRTKL